MEELKKISNREIYIELCFTLAKHGFKFLGTWDLGIVSGFCQECGHLIRYEQNFEDVQTGDEYVVGSSCMFKIYVLSHWRNQIKEKDLENKHLQRAGKWLWVISRDGYLNRVEEEIPQPKDYNEDFKKLADDLKNVVVKVRVIIKREIAEKRRIAEEKRKQKQREEYVNSKVQNKLNWYISHDIDVNKCNDWEINFLDTMYQAYNNDWRLSDKQVDIFNRIKTEKSNNTDIKNNQNLVSVAIVKDVSNKIDYSQLTDWEKNFMESIDRIVDAGHTLSQKQLNIMQKIDDKLSNGEKTDEIVPIDVDEIVCNDREDDKGIAINIRGHVIAWNENCSNYIGRKVNSWFINQLCGIWKEGVVNVVKKETDSAILCDIFVKDGLDESLLKVLIEEKWIPKSQLIDDNFSL